MSKATGEYFRLPPLTQMAGWVLLAMAGVLIWDLSHWWQIRPDYVFGFLVPLCVGYLLFDRWPVIGRIFGIETSVKPREAEARSWEAPKWLAGVFSLGAVAAILGGLVAFMTGAVYRAAMGAAPPGSLLVAMGFGSTLLGAVYLFSERDATGQRIPFSRRLSLVILFLFPALIWVLAAPMFSSLEKQVTTFLLDKVIIVVSFVFDLLLLPFERRGSVIELPKGPVGVEDACSGIRSLTACLFAGSFLAAVFVRALWKKVLLVAASAALAIVGNLFRSLFLTAVAYNYGPEAIDGLVHDATGYAIIGFTLVGLMILLWLFTIRFSYHAEPPDRGEAKNDERPSA